MCERRKVLELFEKQKDFFDETVYKGIEANRKGTAKIRLTDDDGNPLRGIKIKVKQINHEFRFGANLFMLDELETVEKNEAYKKYFADLFNMATLPFYWCDLEPSPGKYRFSKDCEKIYRRPSIDLCIEFCKKNNIEPREHCLVFEDVHPSWVRSAATPEVKELIEERIRVLAEHYKEEIPCWEVINETLLPKHTKNPIPFYRERDYISWSFKAAEKYLKNNELCINDAHVNIWGNAFNFDRSAYYMLIERSLNDGARIESIGMQFHMFLRKEDEFWGTRLFYNPEHICDVLNTYSSFGKPLQISEVTIPAYSYSSEDEEVQADILEKLYSLWFSHPNMNQIVYWNLVDGYAAYAPKGDMTAGENYYYGGLLRFDLSPKPSYKRLKNLITKEWHTELELVTDENGETAFRGFYGDYIITTPKAAQQIKLSVKGNNNFMI